MKLAPSDSPYLGEFGWSVDIEGNKAVIGAWADSAPVSVDGAAYLFEFGPGGWTEVEKFQGSGLANGDTFGYSLEMSGSRVLIGAPNTPAATSSPGYAYLFDLASDQPGLLADTDAISLSQGGAQTLNAGACSAHAGDIYAIAGSASGTDPGFMFGAVPVPLNPDAYFLYTLNHAGAPPLSGSVGLLDQNGYAQASFVIPPGTSPSLAGMTLHHAYAVLDGATLALGAASPAVPIALVP